ncbi:MAG: ribonuclease III [Rhodospirillales bacterium]|nr:ribonuclease III [Rhodospirillales bacterium]
MSLASQQILELCDALGHRFSNADLLHQALTHPSAGYRRGRGAAAYERLEFLGDRVLGLIVAEMLLERFPTENEGALARRHAALVRREALARVAETIGLPIHLVLSKGEEDGGGRRNPATLADACEAVIGALYCDGGLGACAPFVRSHWEGLMAESARPPQDAKTALQEWAQGCGKPLPSYEMVGMSGPAHDPTFEVAVSVDGYAPVVGQGTTKRAAEQAAARTLLETLRQ